MACFESYQWLPVELPKVFAFFSYPENLSRIMPPELQVRTEWTALVAPIAGDSPVFKILEMNKAAGAGSEFVFSFRPHRWAPIRMEWRARIEEYVTGSYFRDTQLGGLMQRWSHRHGFQEENRAGVDGTLILDQIEFEIGYGWAGKLLERYFVLPSMRRSFEHRKSQIERVLQ